MRLLQSRGHEVSWVGALDVTPGEGARAPAVVIVDGEAKGMEIAVVAAAWRRIDPQPTLLVVGHPELAPTVERLRAQLVPAAPEAVAEMIDALVARARDDEATAILAQARQLDIVGIREALRRRMFDYIAGTPLLRRLAARGALGRDEARVSLGLDGARTVRATIEAGALPASDAARLLYALVQAGAAMLSAEPPATSLRSAAVATLRRHLRARREWATGADHYLTLELPRNASMAEIDRATRSLALRYAPEVTSLHDLGDLAPAAKPLWDQIAAARQVLLDARRRSDYDAVLQARNLLWAPPDGDAEQSFQRGQRALAAGQLTAAVSELASAARRQPDEPDYEAYAAWGRVLVDEAAGTPRREAAHKQRPAAEAALLGRRPRPRALFALALVCEAAGDRDAARAHVRDALAIDPQMTPAQKLYQRLSTSE